MITYDLDYIQAKQIRPKITILGVGGAGGNAINAIIAKNIKNITCVAINTDLQALENINIQNKIQIGIQTAQGMGTGANPEVGRIAAEEDIQKIIESIDQSDIVFLIGGLGGGTASGAIPVIARMLQEKQILSIAVVTKPFIFEGSRRAHVCQAAIQKIEEYIDTLIVIPNQKLFESDTSDSIPLMEAFERVNEVIVDSIKAVSDTIYSHGHINVDFADVKTTMTRMGKAIIGIGKASGEKRAEKAIEKAIASPLLELASLKGARSILLNISGNKTLSLSEMNIIAGYIHDEVHPDAHIILGSSIKEEYEDELTLTLIATGFEDHKVKTSQRNNIYSGYSVGGIQQNYNKYNTNMNNPGNNNIGHGNMYNTMNYGYVNQDLTNNQNNISEKNNINSQNNKQQNATQQNNFIDIPAFFRKNNIDNQCNNQ
jgi:cell division protein FtsZ